MGGLDDVSRVIGNLETGLEKLEESAREREAREVEYRRERDRRDEEFRKAGLEAFGKLRAIAEKQDEHSEILGRHEERHNKQDKRNARHAGITLTLGAIGSAIMGVGALVVQYLTSGIDGQ